MKRALELFCDDIFQRRILQGEVGVQPLEPAILVLQFLLLFGSIDLHGTILVTPAIDFFGLA